MTREQLEGLGLTDETLVAELETALSRVRGRRARVDPLRGEETPEKRGLRKRFFDRLVRLWYSGPPFPL